MGWNSDMKKFRFFGVFILVLFTLPKAQSESLFLVCNGIQDSYIDGNKSSEVKVQRTVELNQSKQNIWSIVVDNLREISKQPTTDEFESQGIDVKDNEINAYQDSDKNDKDTYVLSINRISGKFVETLRTKYTGSPLTRTVTAGECAKVDKKI